LLIPFELPELPSCRLAIQTGGIFSDPTLLVDGRPLSAAKDGTFTILGEDASPVSVRLIGRGLDIVPDVRVGDRTVTLLPPLRWFDYAWCLLPVLLLLAGFRGPLSGAAGAFVTYLNLRLFRTIPSPFLHYAVTAVVTLAGLAAYYGITLVLLSYATAPK
ncbi:MAG: hypothetical protein H7Z41_09080, partial [Cytophagales bacterium]|nr:hypothetical protein [Armatimonadota bacterium]